MLLGESMQIAVISSNRDLGCTEPYHGVPADKWFNWRGQARVRYCSSSLQRMLAFPAALRRFQPEAVYLNSMFSVVGTLWPLLWLWLFRHQTRIVLAPRGMLKPSALGQKSWKKYSLLWVLNATGVMRRVVFHATASEEVHEIQEAFRRADIRVISNVPCVPVVSLPPHSKVQGRGKLCFVGRVHPIKNLLWLIELMKRLALECRLTVIGPIEDKVYYNRCLAAVAELPTHVIVEFVGVQTEADVRRRLIHADAMILPTLGENFGHSIFEALAVGTPVIISDRTIWRNLRENNSGWDLSLDRPEAFAAAIDEVAGMDQNHYEHLRRGALDTARHFLKANPMLDEYHSLFFRT